MVSFSLVILFFSFQCSFKILLPFWRVPKIALKNKFKLTWELNWIYAKFHEKQVLLLIIFFRAFNNSLTLFLLMYFTLYNLLRQGQELCAKKPNCLEAMNLWKNIHYFRTVSHHNSLLNTLRWLRTKNHSILTKLLYLFLYASPRKWSTFALSSSTFSGPQ